MSTPIHSRRGQTLVEALVALSILTVGFLGIITLLTKSFQLNRITSDDTQATYLASEGIELAKNIIDYDVYCGFAQSTSTVDWGVSFGLGPGQNGDYALEYNTVPPPCTSPGSLPQLISNKLYFNPDTYLYTYSNSPPAVATDFTRDVKISVPVGSPYELDVQSIVTWNTGSQSNSITLEDHFYNWHP